MRRSEEKDIESDVTEYADNASGEEDETKADTSDDNNAEQKDDVTLSGDSDDGSSSGEDEEPQDKRGNIANNSDKLDIKSAQQEANQASKTDDFKFPETSKQTNATSLGTSANSRSEARQTVEATENQNNTAEAKNNTAGIGQQEDSISNFTSPGANVTGETAANETMPVVTNEAGVNGTNDLSQNGTSTVQPSDSLDETARVQTPNATSSADNTSTGNGGNTEEEAKQVSAEEEKMEAAVIGNMQSAAAVNNTTTKPEDKSEVVMFAEKEMQKNYTTIPVNTEVGAAPTAKYFTNVNETRPEAANQTTTNATIDANQATIAKPQAVNAAKRTGIKKKSEELMTAEEIVEDMDSESDEEDEEGTNSSASGSGSGSGNLEQETEEKPKSIKAENKEKPIAKAKTAILTANEAAFLSSMENDDESSGSNLEVTPESGSGSGDSVEKAVAAEVNQKKVEKIKETKKQEESQQVQSKSKTKQQQQQQATVQQASATNWQQTMTNSYSNAGSNTMPQQAAKSNTATTLQKPANQQTAKTAVKINKQPQQQQLQKQQQQQQKQQQQQQQGYQNPKQTAKQQQNAFKQGAGAQKQQDTKASQYKASTTAAKTQQYSQATAPAQPNVQASNGPKVTANTQQGASKPGKVALKANNSAASSTNAVAGQKPVAQASAPQQTAYSQTAQQLQAQNNKQVEKNAFSQGQQPQRPVAAQAQATKVSKAANASMQPNVNKQARVASPAKAQAPVGQKQALKKLPSGKNATVDGYGEGADLLKTSSKIELKDSDENLPGATGDDITEEDLQKLQSISVNDAAANENELGDLMTSIGTKKPETKKSQTPKEQTSKNNSPKAKSWTMVFNGTESEGNLPGGYGGDYLDDASGDDEDDSTSGSGNDHARGNIEMQIESSIGSSFESTLQSKRSKKEGSGSGSGSGDEYASELLPGDYGSEGPLNIDEEGSGDDDDDEQSGEGFDFMSGNRASGSGNEIDQHIHALLKAHVDSPTKSKVSSSEKVDVPAEKAKRPTEASTSKQQKPINYPSIQKEFATKVADAPKLEQDQPEQKSQNPESDDEETSGSGSGETGESSGRSNEGSGSDHSFTLPFVQPEAPKARPLAVPQKSAQLPGVAPHEGAAVQEAVAHVTQNILNNIRQYQGNVTAPSLPADTRMIKAENDAKESNVQTAEADDDSGSGSASSGLAAPKSEDQASGNQKYDTDDDDDDENETTPEEAETKEVKSGVQQEAGQRGQIEKSKEQVKAVKAQKHEELQPQDEDEEEDPKPKYEGFTVSNFRRWHFYSLVLFHASSKSLSLQYAIRD